MADEDGKSVACRLRAVSKHDRLACYAASQAAHSRSRPRQLSQPSVFMRLIDSNRILVTTIAITNDAGA